MKFSLRPSLRQSKVVPTLLKKPVLFSTNHIQCISLCVSVIILLCATFPTLGEELHNGTNPSSSFDISPPINSTSRAFSSPNATNKGKPRHLPLPKKETLQSKKATQRQSKTEEHWKNFDNGLSPDFYLRKNILTQLGKADPLLCLPKALCAIMTEKRKRINSMPTTSRDPNKPASGPGNEASTNNILTTWNKDAIDNYFQIMKVLGPSGEVGGPAQFNHANKEEVESDSADESSEEESSEGQVYEKSSYPEMSRDDFEYYKEKAKVVKYKEEEDYDPEEGNWWDILDESKPYQALDEIPTNPPPTSWPSRFSKGMSSFFGSILPSVSVGFGKKPDFFSDDDFFGGFRSFKGRSLNGVEQKDLSWLFGRNRNDPSAGSIIGSHKRADKTKKPSKNGESNKNIVERKKNKKMNLGVMKRNKMMIDDPVESFQVAIEIGKQMKDPDDCNYIFNSCPFTYAEVIEIIESSKRNTNKDLEALPNSIDDMKYGLRPTVATAANNVSFSTISYELPSGSQLDVEMKLLDAHNNKNTMSTASPIPIPTIIKMRKPVTTKSKLWSKPKIRLGKRPEKVNVNSGILEEGYTLQLPAPLPTDETTNFNLLNVGDESDNFMLIPTTKSRTGLDEIDTNTTTTTIVAENEVLLSHNKNKTKKAGRPKQKGKKRRPRPQRKQWGLMSSSSSSVAPTPLVLRQPDLPSPITTRYRPIPLSTTINRPSHIINYHFHNSNTHPQVTHSNQLSQPLTVHSYPSPSPNYQKDETISSTTFSTTTVVPTTTQRPYYPVTTSEPLLLRSPISSRTKRLNKNRIRRQREKSKSKQERRNKSEKSSEERIVIRLPSSPPFPPNNHYYSLYPANIPFLSNNPYSSSQSHPLSPPLLPPQSSYLPILKNSIPPQSLSPHTSSFLLPSSNNPNIQSLYSSPGVPFPPLGMFQYLLGKK